MKKKSATHSSKPSKKTASKVLEIRRLESAGAWLKKQNRFIDIADKVDMLAKEVNAKAPY